MKSCDLVKWTRGFSLELCHSSFHFHLLLHTASQPGSSMSIPGRRIKNTEETGEEEGRFWELSHREHQWLNGSFGIAEGTGWWEVG